MNIMDKMEEVVGSSTCVSVWKLQDVLYVNFDDNIMMMWKIMVMIMKDG